MKIKHLLSICAAGILLLQPSVDASAAKPKIWAKGLLITAAGVLSANQLYKMIINECRASTRFIVTTADNLTSDLIEQTLSTAKAKKLYS